ncbi:MAG: 1-(5-phosphoribosyl)-5-[Clostridia bacterium]|nr:1-(5-phosphoribosyl)-5-[(5-phosphoribosylamino)methylideneamino]imidazole-4-carboxamide isomerase [Clostridia bacterium]
MIIFPAIDLVGGKAVRLYKGDYARMTVYDDDPLHAARTFEAAGAEHLHMVDLEGARDGGTPNYETVRRVAQSTGLFVEIGGGIRDMEVVERYLDAGVKRVILGTAAISDEGFVREAVDRFGAAIALGADVKNGEVAVRGWLELSGVTLDAFCEKYQQMGVQTLICTDISRDGAMQGANRALYADLQRKYRMDIVASGGVSSMEDVRALRALGLYGAIIGKAVYTGDIDLARAIEEAKA